MNSSSTQCGASDSYNPPRVRISTEVGTADHRHQGAQGGGIAAAESRAPADQPLKLLIFGAPGIGKTSLVNMIARTLPSHPAPSRT